MAEPEFSAVFRTPYQVFGRPPWPVADRPPFEFERLYGGMGDDLVGLAFAQMCGASGDDPPASLSAVMADLLTDPEYGVNISGGILVRGGEVEIWPGCCCGFDTFREWVESFRDGSSPWMGHDPNGGIVWDGDVATISQHGAGSASVLVARPHFAKQLDKVRDDLFGFCAALETWLAAHGVAEFRAVTDLLDTRCHFREPLGFEH